MKSLYTIVIVFMFYSFGIGQESVDLGTPQDLLLDLQVQVYLAPNYEEINPNFEGSPYFNKEWIIGSLLFNEGDIIEGYKFKYDIYNKSMYFTNGKDTASIANPGILKEIKLGNSRLLFTSYVLEKEKVDKDYFELIEDGEFRLLLHRSCTFLAAEKVTQGYGQTDPARFITDKTFYLKHKEDPAIKIDKEKEFIKVFSDKVDAIEAFIKKNKLKLKKEEDLVKLVKHLNSGS